MNRIAAMTMALALAGCGGTSNPSARPLRVGQTHHGDGVSTTLRVVDYPYTGDETRRPDSGKSFIGLDVKTCLDKEASPHTSTRNSEWSLVTRDGARYAGDDSSSWADWPRPKYPEDVSLVPGQCKHGWLLVQVPEDEQFTAVVYHPEGKTAARWVGTFRRD
jgi:hypothetical protein